MADVAFSIPNSRSLLLDGDGDYLFTTPIPFTNSGNFTIEFWFKTNSSNLLQGLFFSGTPSSDLQRLQLEILTNGALSLYMQANTGNQSVVSAAGLINTNTWYHVAFVRQSPVYVIYLNGNSVASASISVTSNPINLYIGLSRSASILRYLDGYISNFRVVNGSPVYTSDSFADFTPPTQPLYPIQNTTLLTCQAPTIIDTSYNPLPITVVGNARVDDENPFGFSTSTSVSADLFDDISTTDSVINLQIPAAKSVFDIYDIQSSIDAPVNAVGSDQLTTQILLAKSMFEIYDIQSSIDAPVNAVVSNQLTIPTVLPSQRVSQYNVNSRNNFSDIEPILSSDKVVNLSRDFSKIQIVERTSPQKINSLRILIENTQTLVNYSYWI